MINNTSKPIERSVNLMLKYPNNKNNGNVTQNADDSLNLSPLAQYGHLISASSIN